MYVRDPEAGIRDVLHLAYKDIQRGVKVGRHKLIEYHVNGIRRTQLFDLADDPLEINDLSRNDSQADLLAALREELRRWVTDLGDTQEMGCRFWGT